MDRTAKLGHPYRPMTPDDTNFNLLKLVKDIISITDEGAINSKCLHQLLIASNGSDKIYFFVAWVKARAYFQYDESDEGGSFYTHSVGHLPLKPSWNYSAIELFIIYKHYHGF